MNNVVFETNCGKFQKYKVIRLVTANKRRRYLTSESNYHTTNCFSNNLLATKIRKKSKNTVYLGLSMLEIGKTLMCVFQYDQNRPKYEWNCIQSNAKLCYMDTDSFIVHIKTKDVYKDIKNDVKKRFHISNYAIGKPLLMGKKFDLIIPIQNEVGSPTLPVFLL